MGLSADGQLRLLDLGLAVRDCCSCLTFSACILLSKISSFCTGAAAEGARAALPRLGLRRLQGARRGAQGTQTQDGDPVSGTLL